MSGKFTPRRITASEHSLIFIKTAVHMPAFIMPMSLFVRLMFQNSHIQPSVHIFCGMITYIWCTAHVRNYGSV